MASLRPDNKFMKMAIKEAGVNIRAIHGGPFGAAIVKNGKLIALSRNKVLLNNDPTAHAEINAIKIAAKKLGSFDLSGCDIYSTTEPCPMCFSAIHWARIRRLYYGTSIKDVKRLGFNELTISGKTMKKLGRSPLVIISRFMTDECMELLDRWEESGNRVVY